MRRLRYVSLRILKKVSAQLTLQISNNRRLNSKALDTTYIRDLITPYNVAMKELLRRREDPELMQRVQSFLNYDIPDHFKNGPILYLSRHIATPSFTTINFIELCKSKKLPIIIGQDKNDIFVSNNSLKRSLGKMPIVKGTTKSFEEIIEFFTIIDFKKSQGRQLKDIVTVFDVNLIEYHNKLLRDLYPNEVAIVDESGWVDNNHRGDLLLHYKKLLSLLVVHGIMFEFYEEEDQQIVTEVIIPAFEFVEKYFGCKPLICNLMKENIEYHHDWNSYPNIFYKTVKNNVEIKK